jgi:hypothetical protein
LDIHRTPGLLVFRTRLGLTIIDLASNTDRVGVDRVYTCLISEVLGTADGYAARDVLVHDRCRAMLSEAEKHTLTSIVQSAGLRLGAIPAPLLADLLAAVRLSETLIARSLDVPSGALLRDGIQQLAPPGFNDAVGNAPE